jgi:diguanylate cyclase (GGDEF)-like protein/PAS domain S-box-containing protein
MRETAKFISRMVSGKLSSIEALEQSAKVAEANKIVSDLLNYINVDTEKNILERLLPELMTLLNATGIIMVVDGKRCMYGTVPDPADLDALLHWLGSQPTTEIFSCEQLGKLFPPAKVYADIAAGLLTTPLSEVMSSCIIWLRSEKVRTIKWAGNYQTGLAQNSAGIFRLTPRKSFETWTEQWLGRSLSWSNVETGIAAMIALSLPESVAHKLRLEQAGIDRKRSEEEALAARLQLEQLTASVPGVVYQLLITADGVWKFTYLSSGIEALCEVSAAAAYHDHHALTDLILPEDRDSYRAGVERSTAKFIVWEQEHRVKTKSGKIKWLHGAASPQRLPNGNILWSGMLTDITERKSLENQVHQMAFYDTLTNLPNRRMLDDRLSQAMAASKRSGCYGAVLFMDLDNFKPLNDHHGHVVGDLLLIEVASRLKSCIRAMDTVARFGGDEFVVMLCELDTDKIAATAQARVIAEKILSTLSEPYFLTVLGDTKINQIVEHHCTASIGLVLFVNHEGSREEILQQADKAMYQAKEAGRNLIRFYEA